METSQRSFPVWRRSNAAFCQRLKEQNFRQLKCTNTRVCVRVSRLIIHGRAATPSITLWNSLLKAPLGNSFSYIYTVSITPFNWYIYLLNGLFYSSPGHKMWNICAGVLQFLFCPLTMLQATFYWNDWLVLPALQLHHKRRWADILLA